MLTRFPQSSDKPSVYYNLYRLYADIDPAKSSDYKNRLLKDYPDSVFAKVILDPDYAHPAVATFADGLAHLLVIHAVEQSAGRIQCSGRPYGTALYGIAMWLITPAGVHSDAVQAENLRRCLAAGDELETLAALGF